MHITVAGGPIRDCYSGEIISEFFQWNKWLQLSLTSLPGTRISYFVKWLQTKATGNGIFTLFSNRLGSCPAFFILKPHKSMLKRKLKAGFDYALIMMKNE